MHGDSFCYLLIRIDGNRPFCQKPFHELAHILGSGGCDLDGGFGIHQVFQFKQFLIEMGNRSLVIYGTVEKQTVVFSAEGKSTGDSDRAERIETVSVLNDLSFDRRFFPLR